MIRRKQFTRFFEFEAWGEFFLTVPMIYHIHGDPDDFNRHTASYWHKKLSEIGFEELQIEAQGGYWSVPRK